LGYLGRPCDVGIILGLGVDGGRRVEGVDTSLNVVGPTIARDVQTSRKRHRSASTYILVDVVDDLVQVLEPGVGILVVEVRTHRKHDVVLWENDIQVSSRGRDLGSMWPCGSSRKP
jgi:hypothetical protein